jgi:DNA-binding CsgD family transcriptional regulator
VPDTPLDRGLDAFARRAWAEAHAELSRADAEAALAPEAVEQLAMTAYLIGRDVESEELLSRAHHAFLARGEPVKAARCAVWITFGLFSRGDRARAAGWSQRAHRLIDGQIDSAEQGYLIVQSALKAVGEGDVESARQRFGEAAVIGERFGDRDLVNLARQGQGRAMIRLGETAAGVALLDEVMVAVTEGELSPIITGTIYCSVVDACFEMCDLRRAHEWTEALDGWCASQPDLVPYRGSCRVHRAEIMVLRGRWDEGMHEAVRASAPGPGSTQTVGSAWYQRAEIHRLRGEIVDAEGAYREAGDAGGSPQPGLALLRLAQGRVEAALSAIDRATDEARGRRSRAGLLAARIEIRLAAGDRAGARRDADELSAIAADLSTPFTTAIAGRAQGAVALDEGNARAALHELEASRESWRELAAPYDTARTQALIGRACRALGDPDGARMELESACRTFKTLGAATDLAATERLGRSLLHEPAGGALTARELDVLRLVAAGKTNKAIADDLAISEKTVARHLSNIFVKLDIPSRAAATAYAFQHQLL